MGQRRGRLYCWIQWLPSVVLHHLLYCWIQWLPSVVLVLTQHASFFRFTSMRIIGLYIIFNIFLLSISLQLMVVCFAFCLLQFSNEFSLGYFLMSYQLFHTDYKILQCNCFPLRSN